MKILITGANGFVGRALCRNLHAHGHIVVPAVRKPSGLDDEIIVGDIGPSSDWTKPLNGCDAVVHLAARVHLMDDQAENPSALYRLANTDATLNIARQTAEAGVKRFVFVSTIKVNGEGRSTPYRETDVPAPEGPYAVSKWEAEQGLRRLAAEIGLEVVVLRPPLVYGPGVKANFQRLARAVRRGWPLPLGAIDNRRSLLYLGNLVDAIRLCAERSDAAGQTFLLDDGNPISTPDLIRAMAHAMGRKPRILKTPLPLLEAAGGFLGRRKAVARLTGSLFVDSSAIRSHLGWTPPFSMETGLKETLAGLL